MVGEFDRDRATGSAEHQPSAARQSWSFALFAGLTTAAILIVATAVPSLFGGVINQIVGLGHGAQAVTWVHLLVFQSAVVGLTVLMAGVAPGQGSALGWQPPIGRRSWLQPLVVTIVVSITTAALALKFFPDQVARDLAPIQRMVDAGPINLAFATLTIGAPVSEELLFRGYLLHRLMQTPLGFWGGALIANIGWSALHFNYSWLGVADVFLAGLLLSWALWRTKSIWVPIAIHAIYNAMVFFFLLIPSTKSAVPAVW